MRILKCETDERIIVTLDKTIKSDTTNGIMSFGKENDYPQIIERLVYGSQTAKACSEIYSKFIGGDGFVNPEIGKIVVGRDIKNKPTTLDMIRRQIADSISVFSGVYIHCNFNLDAKVVNTNLIPFKKCRFSTVDDKGYSSLIGVSNEWDYKFFRKGKRVINWYNTYNTNKAVFESNVKNAGGIESFNGQIYFNYTNDTYFYPLSTFDSVYLDCDSEFRLQLNRNNELRNGFTKKVIINLPLTDDSVDGAELAREIENFMGVDGNKTMVFQSQVNPVTGELISDGFKVETLDSNMDLAINEKAEGTCVNNIRKAIKGMPALLIDYDNGGLNQSGEMIVQAVNFYNSLTLPGRENISDIIRELYSNFDNEILKNNTNWDLLPVKLL